jgi:tRNA threonylcarbamoyladenosine biosynthesis protein TsaE
MLPDQLAGMMLTPNQAGANAGAGGFAGRTYSVQRVAHRHCHVAQPAFVADAANRAAFGDVQEFRFGPVEQRHQLLAGQAGAFVEVGQGAALGEFVPGADQLAVVAAVDAVADQRAQFERDRPGVLDCQVGNAAPRVQPVRRNDGLRGAHGYAGAAAAAVRRDGLAGRQGHVNIDFAQKKHRAGFAVQQQGVLAAPALPASGGQFGFKHRRGIGEDAVAQLFDLPGNFFTQRLQATAHDLVIVTPPRIHRHDALGRALQATEFDGLPRVSCRRGRRQVIHARRDDADGAGNQLGRARTLEPVRGHVVHVTMKAGRQPGQQAGLSRTQVNTSHANLRESKLARPCLNLKNQLMTVNDHLPIVKNIVWLDEAATATFAQRLARQPAIGDALIELQGDLGAGKTTFVRHLLGALGVKGRIKSPTYAVVEPYTLASSNLNIWHFDFFRFNDPREWEEAGFRDIFASPGLKLVEWPDKAGDHLPPPDLLMAIDVLPEESRAVTLTARTANGEALLA